MYPAEREGGKKRMRKERILLNNKHLCSTKRAGECLENVCAVPSRRNF
jgi:hypothetical protein